MYTLENTLTQQFYARPTTEVAKGLLGTLLCRRLADGRVISARIVETEAYRDNEPACHAHRGPTPRCRIMFGPPGFAYVYFIYGTNHCLNVVTEEPGRGCAVLIRAVEAENMNGPGKICKQLQINREHNGIDLMTAESPLWIAGGVPPKKSEIGCSPRIGVTSAEDLPWRYFLKDHPCLSGPKSYNTGDHVILPSIARRARQLARA